MSVVDQARSEICRTGHCDYFVWGVGVCQDAWAHHLAAGSPCPWPPVVSSNTAMQTSPLPLQIFAPAPTTPTYTEVPTWLAPPPGPVYGGPIGPVTPAPVSVPVATSAPDRRCPAAYPYGQIDELGQLLCKRVPQGPVPVPYNGGSDLTPQVYRPAPPGGGGSAGPSAGSAPAREVPAGAGGGPGIIAWLERRTLMESIPNWAIVAGVGVGLYAMRGRAA